MVLNCVAYGCNYVHNARDKIPFHSFPFKRPEILKLWVTAIKRENWFPSKTSKLCGKHFLENDYQNKPGCTAQLLKPNAVPSVFSFPKHLSKKVPLPRRKIMKKNESTLGNKNKVKAMEVDISNNYSEPSTSTLNIVPRTVNQATQTYEGNNTLKILRRKIKTLQQKVQRRNKKITCMKEVIKEISNSGYSNENLDAALKNYFEGLPLELVLLQKRNKEETNSGQRRYSALMKQFAQTLYFYSPKAFNFLRKYFVLPNGRTIRKWLSSVNCEPGILQEVLDYLKNKNSNFKNCALIMDGMSIRKQVVWDNSEGKFIGNVNYGGIIDVDFDMAASEALFLQIVSYVENFKCPVAYFLIKKADANLQAQLIQSCIRSLYDSGIIVRSITCDGTLTNIATYNNLGCKILPEKLISHFSHPCDPTKKIYCMLDTCHMLKLTRNTFGEKYISSPWGNISWHFIQELDNIQQTEKLRLANSLSSQHVMYRNKVMNVQLAAQTLSSGVADAIEYLQRCGHDKFQNSSATIEFIRQIDKIFDKLNCRNPYGTGYKAPIRPKTIRYFQELFSNATDYLKSLKVDGIPILFHNRRTFAIGFILTMQSTLGLVKDLFSLEENPLKYFLSYKCSQDHLELFFSCIRSRGGWNNNPNAQQLKWALRQLLFRNAVDPSLSANCAKFETYCTPAFEFRSDSRQNKRETNDNEDLNEINSFIGCLGNTNLTDFQENVLFYIAGYIVRNLLNRTTCIHCSEILLYRDNMRQDDHSYASSDDTFKKFTNCINRGGLVYSDVVFKIISLSEKHFRFLIQQGGLPKKNLNIKNLLTNTAIKHFVSNIKLFQPKHPVVQEFLSEECHEIQLIRKTVELFLKCRMPHHSKLINLELHGKAASIRQKLSKIILFKNC